MDAGILVGAVVGCAVGSILPWINAELVLLAAAVALPTGGLPALVAACVVAQMMGKTTLYGVTRWAPERLPSRVREALGRAEPYCRRRGLLAAAVFFGSSVSLPPFYLVTLASGLVRVPFAVFALAGLSGTAVRYACLVWLARAIGLA
jgi:membrane protein YqaA with SNARE-associated domain